MKRPRRYNLSCVPRETMQRAPRPEAPPADSYFRFQRGELPVLIEVPHAGLAIPEVVRSELRTPLEHVLRDADLFVDQLYAEAPGRGASMLTALTSRYVIDLNRAPDDVDLRTVPDHPAPRGAASRGVVWRTTTDGRPLLRRPLSYRQLEARLRRFHRPYHAALRAELQRLRSEHGYAIAIAAHSMPSVGRGPGGRSVKRPDVVPGSRGRTSADPRLLDLVAGHFEDAGLSVRHDDPYRGGYTTAHYGRPAEGWHVVQIELSRALYVDERTSEPKADGFARLQSLLGALIEKVGQLDLGPT